MDAEDDRGKAGPEASLKQRLEEITALLMPLRIPVAPFLEEALGYEGTSRRVAFYQTRKGKELLWDDGRWKWKSGGQVTAWSAFTQHPLVKPHLAPFYFGGEGKVATHYLVLDRQERQLYAGELLPVLRLLAMQHPIPPSWEEIVAKMKRGVRLVEREADTPPLPSEMRAWQNAQRRLEDEMLRWLDNYSHSDPDDQNEGGEERGGVAPEETGP